WFAGMRAKLGLFNEEKQDVELIENLLSLMQKHKADYTNTFRALTLNPLEDADLFSSDEFIQWHKLWQERLTRQDDSKADSQQLMQNSNPAIIPRNHRVEGAIEAAVENGDYSVMENLLNILSNPYAHSQEQTDFNTVPVESNQPYRTFCGT
ncbi:MAG: protein adenylyltransferase SelO family protein, partial [Planococcaceae bacterium]|nr:protein adenylyltransferase SelO family protein [Planococcaceae bacterium]